MSFRCAHDMAPKTLATACSHWHHHTLYIYIGLLLAPTFVTSDATFTLNPVTNFCSRWWSQSVVKNQVLYIDSGLQKWNGTDIIVSSASKGVYGMNNYLLTIPLDFTWNWKNNIIINAEPKNETSPTTGANTPSLMRGTMYHGPANSSEVYIYGGTTFMANQSFQTYTTPTASTYALWSYNYNTTDYPWRQFDVSQPWMPNHGASAEAVDQGIAFYLNGQIDWGTSTSTLNVLSDEETYMPVSGMVVLDLYSHTSRNISTASIRGNAPRVGGKMEYIAPVGSKGVLVALGGQISNSSTVWANVSQGNLLDFSSVDVFDVGSLVHDTSGDGKWFLQNTTGEIPPPRIDFCTVSISAPDNSSHHIYMYGGQDPTHGDPDHANRKNMAYDDVHVLSLPAFEWTIVYGNAESPRYGHNCHVAGGRQMITVGGNISNSGVCDWELKGVAVLDMSNMTWGSVFTANASGYEVPPELFNATGGTAKGAATIKEPVLGWTNEGLKTVFNTVRDELNPALTNPTPKKKNHVGAIAGGVVGGVVGLALIGLALFFLHRRHRSSKTLVLAELADDELHDRRAELADEKMKGQLQSYNENNPAELADPGPFELNAPRTFVEADGTTVIQAAELSGMTVVKGASPGVPFIRTPGDDLPTSPFATPLSTPPISDTSTLPGSPHSPVSPFWEKKLG